MLRLFIVVLTAVFLQASTSQAWLSRRGSGVSTSGPTSVTINNFSGVVSGSWVDQLTRYDTDGNKIDAHAGHVIQVGSTFYLYGESYFCGYGYQWNGTPWCGIKVYSSTDMVNWTYQGFPFDATTPYWQNRCKGLTGGGGCYRPSIIYNAANNNYVMWIFQQPGGSPASAQSYFAFTCTTPAGPCTQQADPSHLTRSSQNGDQVLFKDASGNGYVAYTNYGASFAISVEALTADYLDSTGAAVSTGATGEGMMAFIKGGVTYVGFSSLGCAYCGGATSSYVSASSPLGTYGSAVTLNATSCNGQTASMDAITGSGTTTYVYWSDQWFNGNHNQGLAGIYFHALTFTGSAIDPFACANSVTIPGLSPAPPAPLSPAPDQTSTAGLFIDVGDIQGSTWRMQTFVSQSTTLSKVVMSLGQNCYSGTCVQTGLPNNAIIDIVTLNGSNDPVTTLGTVTLTPAQLNWSEINQTLTYNLTGLSVGAKYGIVVHTTSTTNNVIIAKSRTAVGAYPAGVERYSTNAGASWTTEGTDALRFSTYH